MSITTTWKGPLFFKLEDVESIAEEEATVTLNYSPPVILPEDVELETDAQWIMPEPELSRRYSPVGNFLAPVIHEGPFPQFLSNTSALWLWLFGAMGLFLASLLVMDTYHFVASQYANGFLVGTFFLLLTLSISSLVLALAWNSYQNLRTVSAFQEEGRKLRELNGHGNAIYYINHLAQFYLHRPDLKTALERFYVILNDSHQDRDVCHLFSTQVMKEIDQQAYCIVSQRAKETALLVMISQVALIDTVLTLWRNVRMIRDIATLYGTRPGVLGTFSLTASVLQNLVYADVSGMIADATAEMLGGSVISMMSSQITQGLGSGILTARLGIQTMQACRPLPFTPEEKPRLKEIRWDIMTSLNGIFGTTKDAKGKAR
jgi:putative membrane protein